jgi:CRISPR system Cascade subunit CasE
MTELFLSRIRLRRDAPAHALARLLVPDDAAARTAASHHLVWSLFADSPDRRRDFLWREERPGQFMALSSRPPEDAHGLFDLDYKPFAPLLEPGDILGFSLRANPVISRQTEHGKRGQRHDVVMDALRQATGADRAAERPGIIASAGVAWLHRQGETHGFTPADNICVDGYETVRIVRQKTSAGKKPGPIRFGRLDITGMLRVSDPPRFLAALAAGFGKSQAFGCGLMLIRRTRPP